MRTFVFIIVMLVGTGINMSANTTSPYEHIEIDGITYRYQVVEKENAILETFLDIEGPLELSICLPSDVVVVIVEWRHHYEDDPFPDFYNRRKPFETEEGVFKINAILENMDWNSGFRAYAIFKDGHHEHTQSYEINEYIKEEDLELVRNQSNIDETDYDDVSVTMRNNCVVVEPQSETAVDIVQPDGISIFSGSVSGRTEIPVDSKLVIVRCKTKDKTITKKFRVNT